MSGLSRRCESARAWAGDTSKPTVTVPLGSTEPGGKATFSSCVVNGYVRRYGQIASARLGRWPSRPIQIAKCCSTALYGSSFHPPRMLHALADEFGQAD